MTKTPIDYSNCIFYKIVSKDVSITDLYVGHTTSFTTRKSSHKFHCNNENDKAHNFRVYQFIRTNGGWNNWDMVMIQKENYNSSLEAHTKERYYVESLNATLNSNIPSRTQEEYREANKDNALAYREANKDNALAYREDNKDNALAYREDNKDKAIAYGIKYREVNSDKIKVSRDANKENKKIYNTIYRLKQKQLNENKMIETLELNNFFVELL